ncbi:uncharacterized protein PHALS_06793 [Plasmopara halstedii]|uniref:Uncharacterized protein n=1 Tax=Plasmopara halstedii TaxID=4781 RepID=A0A0N7L864_PLAHL|nr:uncharacterized protein PHALS_06793 [Plasmopara halstedii]CEG49003.1 hypothetical protein PHALS_06793 [Plasmopara halstedii]|eukprot:XP_024585372.1 hypothetical protein PHALS_06793 [Plasmopara halstedii]
MQHAFCRVLVRAARSSRCTVYKAHVGPLLHSPTLITPKILCCVGDVRFESSESTPSRFLSLVDDEKTKKGEEDDESEEYGDENLDEDSEGKDGDIEADTIPDVNKGGVEENDELDELIMELFLENPLRWTPEVLARKFHLAKPRVEAIIWLKRMEAELTPEEFRAKVQEAKDKAKKEMEEKTKKIVDAEAAGNEKEVARLKKRARQEEEELEPDHELDDREKAMLMDIDKDAYRNPDFFFLSDEFEGYPPLFRRMGRHGQTDQLYPEEAIELQRLASNNKIEPLKNFANPNYSKKQAKYRLAIKDISTKKKYLLVRDETHTLRLATNEEVLPRTWVRRAPFFRGLDKELA